MATENIMMPPLKKGGTGSSCTKGFASTPWRRPPSSRKKGAKRFDRPHRRDESFNLSEKELDALMDAGLYVGRAPKQVDEYLNGVFSPCLCKTP
jgi:adenylosuccinate lyase